MDSLSTFATLFASFASVVTAPTAQSMAVLLRGAVLAPRARTVTGCLVAAWPWVDKRWQSYSNVLRRAKMNMPQMARLLFEMILSLLPDDAPVYLAVDETLVRRWGRFVPAVGMHHDAVQSSHKRNVVNPGHKWVVLSVLIRLPCMNRPVALPILSALYTAEKQAKHNYAERLYRRHRTVPELTLLLVRMVARWVPQRHLIVVGDGAYATHNLARAFCPKSPYKTLRRTCLVSRFRFDAATYGQADPCAGSAGRPRVKGQKLPSPGQIIQHARPEDWQPAKIDWYAGSRKHVQLYTGTGLWYKSGLGAKTVRWVVVRDPAGACRDEIFFTTAPDLTPVEIVEMIVRRWSLETTFQEMREHLGLETLRNWSRTAVGRSVPLLLSVYSLIVVWFSLEVDEPAGCRLSRPWYEKQHTTFSDMLEAARVDILSELINDRPDPATPEHLFRLPHISPTAAHPYVNRRAA